MAPSRVSLFKKALAAKAVPPMIPTLVANLCQPPGALNDLGASPEGAS
jgi:hypothetical protein